MIKLSTYTGYSDRYNKVCRYYHMGDAISRGCNLTQKRAGFLSRTAQTESIVVIKDPFP